MYQAALRFHPDMFLFTSPGNKPRAGCWRVVECHRVDLPQPARVIPWHVPCPHGLDPIETKALLMMVAKPLLKGQMANPRKLAAEYLEHQRGLRRMADSFVSGIVEDIIYFGAAAHAA